MKFNNILVVLNPENDKQYALARAVRLAKEQKNSNPVKITLFLAIYDLSYEMSALLSPEERAEMHRNVIEQRKLAIQPYIEKYASDGINFSSTVVWHSNEAEAITTEVETHNYDLVVKYTNAEESLKSLIVTPVDWQILRKCPTPILVVKDGDWKHQRRILVAVNVSDDENEAHSTFNDELVSLSMDLADSLDRGNIHLVTAYPPTPINMAIDLPEFSSGEYSSGLRGQYLLNMKALRQKYGIDGDHTHVLEGFPEDVIPQVAEKLEAELVILGTIGRTGLSAAFLGNTAEHVISKLNCNLLAIKPSKKDD
ncbi:universal stress protein UspE [Aggregatibacter aphrophilus]|jgi:uspA protein|uniref:Universal stress protein E homolog n=2 Tax=Aggregatibacter aphrophilus TaxID=732 RepID=A0A0K1N3L2_AGGAP|nr:universal stress protein UspE [Aggregatibacter aphrophilus]AKU63699.1 universal stress protein UspE [Aggregatibacter aphrophilus]KNE86109.1 universal stress protein UspE [Aggregatibacter aphrophilus ATCC 33389]OBY52507.1 universal stress protein UspE [Aggregatibacter aphrophilus]OBY55294.1 universal stress protein UspE [Aggregatibacter aphrophilus]RDE89254.1 universal stress protein UspE [Aggregatibacter aphrophilus]